MLGVYAVYAGIILVVGRQFQVVAVSPWRLDSEGSRSTRESTKEWTLFFLISRYRKRRKRSVQKSKFHYVSEFHHVLDRGHHQMFGELGKVQGSESPSCPSSVRYLPAVTYCLNQHRTDHNLSNFC